MSCRALAGLACLLAACGGQIADDPRLVLDARAPGADVEQPVATTVTDSAPPAAEASFEPVDAAANSEAAVVDVGAETCALTPSTASRWIAFDSNRDGSNRDLYVVRADGSEQLRLTTDPTNEVEPAFSNDAARLAFASDRSGTMQVYAMDLATYAVTQLTTLPGGADQPSFSRDDTAIAFHSGVSVYVMGADGSHPRVVSTGLDSLNQDEYPSFSSDGSALVFDRDNEIDAIQLTGSGLRHVVQNTTTLIETPSVSPDGSTLAFAIDATGGTEVIALAPFAASTNGFDAQRIAPPGAPPARRPAWGPDGVIAFEQGRGFGAVQFPTAAIALSVSLGSAPCELVGGMGDSRNPTWAPAGYQPH